MQIKILLKLIIVKYKLKYNILYKFFRFDYDSKNDD